MAGQTGRIRSPKYPFIDLPSAVNRLRQMYDFVKRGDVDFNTLVDKCWGYTPTSGSAKKVFAALKTFGLIADAGKGAARKAHITDLGLRIIHGTEEDRSKALAQAAMKPKSYEDVWEKWGNDLPNDDVIKSHLILEKKFNDSRVDGFLADYKRTIEYANLTESANIDDEEPDENQEDSIDSPEEETPYTPEKPTRRKPPMKPGTQQATFPLDEGEVFFQWPETLSQTSMEDLETWLELVKRKIQRSVKDEDNGAD